jgi:hypothetical protein
MESPLGTSQYFSSPADVPNTGKLSCVDNKASMLVNGVATCRLTSLQMQVAENATQEATIFCETVGAKSRGKVMVSGSFTAILEDDEFLSYFDLESEITLAFVLNSLNDEQMAFYAPRVKINSSTMDDGEKVIIVTCNFDMLEYIGSTVGVQKTTLTIQDTTLS